jgi:hypothetical protein
MNPEQSTAVLIIYGILAASILFWKIWISFRYKKKELDHAAELSRLEKEKIEIFMIYRT